MCMCKQALRRFAPIVTGTPRARADAGKGATMPQPRRLSPLLSASAWAYPGGQDSMIATAEGASCASTAQLARARHLWSRLQVGEGTFSTGRAINHHHANEVTKPLLLMPLFATGNAL